MVEIYILLKNNVPFYVGKSVNSRYRFYHHLIKYGKEISLEIIDKIDKNEWKFWERHYISLFKSWGFKLENKNEGGGGPEIGYWKGKISPLRGRTTSEKTKEKMRNSALGRKQSKETIEKRIKCLINKNISQNQKDKISLANKGKPKPKGFGEKLSEKLKGKPLPIGTGEKISKGKKGKKVSKDKLINMKGRKSKIFTQFDLNMNPIKDWNNLKDISNQLGIKNTTLWKHLNGKSETCGGYVFKYK